MSDVTQILSKIESGDQKASEELLPLVYDELRELAAARMASERADHTLQATALVHEAYVRLVGTDDSAPEWHNCGHFFAAAAEAMRRVLVEHARRKQTLKAGGGRRQVPLAPVADPAAERRPDILALNEVLDRLEAQDPRAASLVKLRYFGGMTIQQAAQALAISVATAKTEWTYAKTWLHVALGEHAD